MKSTVENLSPTRIKLAIEVPYAELKASVDAAYKQIGSQIRVPGFRPGKIPARIIDQRVGRSAVLEEAVNQAMPKAYSEAVLQAGVAALGQPDIEVTNLQDNESLAFTAEVDVRPEIEIPDYQGLAVSVEDVAVTEEEIGEQLAELQARFGTLKTVDRAGAVDDFVTLDLVASVDGTELEGGTTSGVSYRIGSEELIPGLDAAITGKSAGDTAQFTSSIAYGEHAGSQADVAVTVQSVKERELPALDDEFVQLASEFDTIAELRDDLSERLLRIKRLEQGAEARDKVLEALLGLTEVPVPESSVKSEVEWREHDVIHALDHDDAAFEQYLESEGKTRESHTAELHETAEKSVRTQLILDAIAEAEQVTVSDAELTSFIVSQARRYQMAPKDFAEQISKSGNIAALMSDVRRNKALAAVLQAAVVTDASGNVVDLSALGSPQGQLALQDFEEGADVDSLDDDLDDELDDDNDDLDDTSESDSVEGPAATADADPAGDV